jgi:hypothetical protein
MKSNIVHKAAQPRLLGALCLSFVLSCAPALAQNCPTPSNTSIFNLSLCVEGQIASIGSNSIADIIDQIDADQLRRRFSGYDENVSGGEFRLDLRGLPVTLGYDRSSSTLNFAVPSLGINETFNGGTRDASNDLFVDYIKQNGEPILRALLRVSAIDPLAGNPASVQSQMAAGDFEAGVDPIYDTLPPGGSFGLGARFGSYGLGEFTQDVLTLPISYSYTFANHDRLIVRAPITYMTVDGAESYRGALGLSYRKNIFSRWSLTPSLGYGITGSTDLGSLGHIFSGSLTSDLMLYDGGGYRLSMGNMAGYYLTLPVRLGDYSVDYDLKNTITRNGLLLAIPLTKRIWGQQLSFDIFVTDTRLFGDALYCDNYQEIGVSIGPLRSADKLEPNTASHPFGLGIKYLTGEGDIDGFELNFGYRF